MKNPIKPEFSLVSLAFSKIEVYNDKLIDNRYFIPF